MDKLISAFLQSSELAVRLATRLAVRLAARLANVQAAILVPALALFLAACDVEEPLTSAAEDGAAALKTQNDDVPDRLVSLQLEAQLSASHTAVLAGRVVVAEPVYTVPATMARAQGLTEGIKVVYVGKSCSSLLIRYPDLSDCVEEETLEFETGDPIATVETDSAGFATALLGGAAKYRLRVQSWATEEDAKCFWGGESTIDNSQSEVNIPLLVFCE